MTRRAAVADPNAPFRQLDLPLFAPDEPAASAAAAPQAAALAVPEPAPRFRDRAGSRRAGERRPRRQQLRLTKMVDTATLAPGATLRTARTARLSPVAGKRTPTSMVPSLYLAPTLLLLAVFTYWPLLHTA
ncbi:MAG: hypothetical protein ACWA66_17720, partial [Methylibium petroleiphilum]